MKDMLQELTLLHTRFPGSLQRIQKAIEQGSIEGWSYSHCALHHALNSDDEHVQQFDEHVDVVNDENYTNLCAPRVLSDELAEELYGDSSERIGIEDLIFGVDLGETAEDSSALQELQELIEEVLA